MTTKKSSDQLPDLLKKIYAEKKGKNAKFSMRAFARKIGISQGRLSEIMSGKRNLTLRVAQKFVSACQLNQNEQKKIYDLVRAQKHLKTKKIVERRFISSEDFEKICHWPYYALLALIESSGIDTTVDEYAQKLQIEKIILIEMLKQLEKIAMIKNDHGCYSLVEESTITTQDVLSHTIQKFHQELVVFHLSQMEKIPIDLRMVESLILPFSINKVPQAKRMVRHFLEEFQKKFGHSKGEDVFGISLLFSPLNRLKESFQK